MPPKLDEAKRRENFISRPRREISLAKGETNCKLLVNRWTRDQDRERGKRSSGWFIGRPINMITARLRDMVGLTCRAANFPQKGDTGDRELPGQLSPGPCNSPKVTNAFTDFVKRKTSRSPPFPSSFNVRLIRSARKFCPRNSARSLPRGSAFAFHREE